MKRARSINDGYLRKGGLLGQGASSDVFCAETKTLDAVKVAIKRLKLVVPKASTEDLVPREVGILKEIGAHPNLIVMLELVRDAEGHAFIVLEWMQHDLRGLIRSPYSNHFSRAQVKGYAIQFMRGVAHCHAHNYIHLDLKPENVLVSAKGEVKLTDFGLAERYDPALAHNKSVVTYWYRPIEVFYRTPRFEFSIDMWSAGCIVAELLLNKVLLAGESEDKQPECIYALCGTPIENGWPGAAQLPQYVSPPTAHKRDLDGALRVHNKTSRAGFFTKHAIDLLDRLLALDPEKRITAADALAHPYFIDESPKPLEPWLMPMYDISYFGSVRRK